MIAVPEGDGLCDGRTAFGESEQQDHQHSREDAVGVGVGGEHFAEHVKNVLPDRLILSGAEEQALPAVFIVDAA